MKQVGIIGGAGYIGSYNTKRFLEEGYKVRVSTLDLSNKSKYGHLHKLPKAEHLEIVQMDVQDLAALKRFLVGCSIVVHGGTPFQLDVEDPRRDLLDPTIKGTENFLKTVSETAGIEKVVFIASVAALNTHYPFLPEREGQGPQFSEKDPPYINEQDIPYAQAKYLAHQVVEKFVAANPDPGFEISSISPTGVVGKSLSGRQDATSMGVQHLFKHKIAPNEFFEMFYKMDVEWTFVDVRDVAEAVFQAAIRKGLHGRNYIASSETYPISDATLMLNGKSTKNKAKVVYLNDLAQKELGVTFRPAEESLNWYSA